MRILILLLFISGCAMDGYAWRNQRAVDTVEIRKIETSNAAQLCAEITGIPSAVACADWSRSQCVIIVPHNSPALIAHEAAHCFGWIH